ncbi:MAG TPA: hypothetical protein VLZ83_08735, partial [Edaphocola sp.]|nr:hypothetical protein [Edaphocola sp.]
MKFYYYLIGIVFLFFVNSIHLNAQNKDYYGFSKTFVYSGDSLKRGDASFYTLDFIPNSTNIIFALNSLNSKNTVQEEWFKIDINGNKIAQSIDSVTGGWRYNQKKMTFLNKVNPENFYVAGWYLDKLDQKHYLTLQKIDTSLNSKWKKIYALGPNDILYKNTTLALNQKHLLMCFIKAEKDATRPNGIKNALIGLWKMDTLGNIVWKKTIDSLEWNNAIDITHAHDGNLMICGRTSGYGVSTNGAGFIMKIDTAGNKIWHKVYNLPDYNGLEKIIATGDGHYICAGWARTPSTVIYMSHKMPNGAGRLLKIDENGNIIWDKIIDISDREESFRTLVLGNNGDIIAFGSSNK